MTLRTFSLLFAMLWGCTTATPTSINTSSCCANEQDATVFAFLYGSPLIAYRNYSTDFFADGGVGTNKISGTVGLAGPENQTVHHPNPDCTFANALIDLSQHDLVITLPRFEDNRFWATAFYDAYGSNFATASIELHTKPGKYLIRRADDVQEPWGLTLGNSSSQYRGYINFPTIYGLLLTRILSLNDTEDIPIAEDYEKGITLEQVARELQNEYLQPAPALTHELLDISNVSSTGLQAMELLARVGYYNQPLVTADRYRVGAIVAQAGIDFFSQKYTPEPHVNFTEIVSAATTTALQDKASKLSLSNGWEIQNETIAGIFYTDYAERAGAAAVGFLGDTSNININPGFKGYGTQVLPSGRSWLLTFHGRVPVKPEYGGFWSVTVYLGDGNLWPNAIDRYTLGNRDEIRYPDGTLVYTKAPNNGTAIGTLAGSIIDADKPFQILLQGERPPANWTSNWLPMPTNGSASLFKSKRGDLPSTL